MGILKAYFLLDLKNKFCLGSINKKIIAEALLQLE